MEEKENQNRQYQDSVFVYLFTHHIEKLLSVCKALDPSITSELKEYAEFVRIVKENIKDYGKVGYDKAITCIKHNILKDLIAENAKGVEGMLVAEYDYDADIRVQREECYRVGVARGFLTTAQRMKKANFETSVIQEMTGLSKEEIEKL